MLNFRGARHSYFQLNPKVMGIEDKLIDNKVKYEGLAIERIYFQ